MTVENPAWYRRRMRALLQRVSSASVTVGGRTVGQIGPGLLVLAGVHEDDDSTDAEWIAGKLATLRIFNDDAGKMNRSVIEAGGKILLVSQFTLHGDARKGRRPSFEKAARPQVAVPLLEELQKGLESQGLDVATGEFGAHMIVELVNDGPVTLMLDSEVRARGAQPRPTFQPGRLEVVSRESRLHDVPLVLASGSPRRRDLLRDLGLSFTMTPPDIDESKDVPDDPTQQALILAERKAAVIAKSFPESLVLAADTLVEVDGQALGKPADADDARRMLRMLSGRDHRVVTGVCTTMSAQGIQRSCTATTLVKFVEIPASEIDRYIETGEPFGKAGSYAIQGMGGLFVMGVEGEYSNVVGLPLAATLDLLHETTRASRAGASRPAL